MSVGGRRGEEINLSGKGEPHSPTNEKKKTKTTRGGTEKAERLSEQRRQEQKKETKRLSSKKKGAARKGSGRDRKKENSR